MIVKSWHARRACCGPTIVKLSAIVAAVFLLVAGTATATEPEFLTASYWDAGSAWDSENELETIGLTSPSDLVVPISIASDTDPDVAVTQSFASHECCHCATRCASKRRCRRCECKECLLWRLIDPERERVFPIWNEEARRFGYQLPLPFGAGANIAYIDQTMNIDGIRIGAAGNPPALLPDVPPFQITSQDTNVGGRFDFWVLPFLNVYGLVGRTSGTASGNVVVSGVPGLLPDTVIPVSIDYAGDTYGGGCTGAIGYKSFFAAFDWNYTETMLSGLDNGIRARTFAPRFGLQNPKFAVWVGAFYMNVDKELSTTTSVGAIPVQIVVDLDVETAWNPIYGLRWVPCPNVEMMVEHGFNRRNQVIGAAAFRF